MTKKTRLPTQHRRRASGRRPSIRQNFEGTTAMHTLEYPLSLLCQLLFCQLLDQFFQQDRKGSFAICDNGQPVLSLPLFLLAAQPIGRKNAATGAAGSLERSVLCQALVGLLLQGALGLRREESIRIEPCRADMGGSLFLDAARILAADGGVDLAGTPGSG